VRCRARPATPSAPRSRRTWIRGQLEVGKRYLDAVMAHNPGVILRKQIGVGEPRECASMRVFVANCAALWLTILAVLVAVIRRTVEATNHLMNRLLGPCERFSAPPEAASSAACEEASL
jgi:hypothetical protein